VPEWLHRCRLAWCACLPCVGLLGPVGFFPLQVGIGVAFASSSGEKFGVFVTATLAVHNIPEGLAVRHV
jgi:hypothetical protein